MNPRQIFRSILHARHALGLLTRISTSKEKDHSNALAENTVNRIRGLCGTLMEQLQSNIKMKIGISNPLWSWAARHAAWLINRYKPVRGAAPYELVHGRLYRGVLAAFAEPMCAYYKTSLKCEKKWHRSRQRIFLTRSVRCVGQSWGLSLPFYKFFSAPSYDYQTGFGARIVPTKREALALPTSTAMIPFESIVTKFRDHEAEAVAEKAAEENREALEMAKMSVADDPQKAVLVPFEDEDQLESVPKEDILVEEMAVQESENVQEKKTVEVTDDTPLLDLKLPMDTKVVYKQDTPGTTSAPSSASRPQADEEPRSSPTTRPSVAGDEEHSTKKARMSPAKKLRIDKVTLEMASCIRAVKIGEEELYTIDEPDADPLEHNTLDELYDFDFEDTHEGGEEVPETLDKDGGDQMCSGWT